jgi:hypothetical protein
MRYLVFVLRTVISRHYPTKLGIQVLDSTGYIQYREHTFLAHPSVARNVQWDKETVYLYWPEEKQPVRYAAGVNIVMDGNLTDKSLRERLEQFQFLKHLHFENLEPHAFAGFVSESV